VARRSEALPSYIATETPAGPPDRHPDEEDDVEQTDDLETEANDVATVGVHVSAIDRTNIRARQTRDGLEASSARRRGFRAVR
jgi:hypothetical protein